MHIIKTDIKEDNSFLPDTITRTSLKYMVLNACMPQIEMISLFLDCCQSKKAVEVLPGSRSCLTGHILLAACLLSRFLGLMETNESEE